MPTTTQILKMMQESAQWIYRYGAHPDLCQLVDALDAKRQRHLIRQALVSRDSNLRNTGAWLLSRLGGPWVPWVSDEERTGALKGLRALGSWVSETDALKNGLRSEDRRVRSQCAMYILESREVTKDEEIRAGLLHVLEQIVGDPETTADDLVRCLEGLASLGGNRYVSVYKEACEHPLSSVRQAAVSALCSCVATDEIERLLHQALGDTDARVRLAALDGLRTFGFASCIPGMLKLLEDHNNIVRGEARSVFQEIATADEQLRQLTLYPFSRDEDTALWAIDLLGSRKCSFAARPLGWIVRDGNREAWAKRRARFVVAGFLAAGGALGTAFLFAAAVLLAKSVGLLLSGASFSPGASVRAAGTWGALVGGMVFGAIAAFVVARALATDYRPARAVRAALALRRIS
jgi:hypothetical protein